jgi:molecular chaperone DnaJ
MNHAKAYEILGLDSSAKPEDIKKAFRKLSATMHPDKLYSGRSKGNGNTEEYERAEEKYKQITAAYELLKNSPRPPSHVIDPSDFFKRANINFNPFGPPGASVRRVSTHDGREHIKVDVDISFKESVLGAIKKIKVDRDIRCDFCKGKGFSFSESMCDDCGGSGFISTSNSVNKNSVMSITVSCAECVGSGRGKDECKECSGSGSRKTNSEFTIKIPGGVCDGQVVNMPNAGNYFVVKGGYCQGNIFIIISVEEKSNIIIDGDDVISHIDISLYDALVGVTKKVETVFGEKEVLIEKKIKHGDKVLLSKHGVGGMGNHVFIVNIEYPENCEDLINFLEKDK